MKKTNKILIISTCKEKLHELEFIKPIEDILKKQKTNFTAKHYKELSLKDINKAKKIIICGTSLQDNEFIEDINQFQWIKNSDKPILGICAGMQIIGLIFNENNRKEKINTKTEIGFYTEKFRKNFLNIEGEKEVYHLHNNSIDFSKSNEFEVFASSENVSQAVKHKSKNIFGILFHPEVRNKELIINFVNQNN